MGVGQEPWGGELGWQATAEDQGSLLTQQKGPGGRGGQIGWQLPGSGSLGPPSWRKAGGQL